MKSKIFQVFIIIIALLYPATYDASLKACEKESTLFSISDINIPAKEVNTEESIPFENLLYHIAF